MSRKALRDISDREEHEPVDDHAMSSPSSEERVVVRHMPRMPIAGTKRREEDELDRLSRLDGNELAERRMREERERILASDEMHEMIEKLKSELGSDKEMSSCILGCLERQPEELSRLDLVVDGRDRRIGLLNAIQSPSWLFKYLIGHCDSKTELVEELYALAEGRGSERIRRRFQSVLPNSGQTRFREFASLFSSCRRQVEAFLAAKEIPLQDIQEVVTDALSDKPEAVQAFALCCGISEPNARLAFDMVRQCEQNQLTALLGALPTGKAKAGRLAPSTAAKSTEQDASTNLGIETLDTMDPDASKTTGFTGIDKGPDSQELVVKVKKAKLPKASYVMRRLFRHSC
ncbi:unnamed protein product [Protopolystoma xenopodis]|uniref:Uncharacterized protein n=1 Tax=Protopolystoma xenopodis TaxID=117903 RepID=A0A3S5AFF8_9PLAT|nr:unnamed protein product [Protopolystoma xenopodis]